ncbi:MAG TPA: ATP-binding protein [Terriglobales bacterium]|jgi:signal transduction histidine kinase|nr:ATP-binding protein [Terriglobales bacterium]
MFRFRDYSIPKKLTWMNLVVSGAALGLACASFIAYDLVSIRDTVVRNLSIQAQIVGSNSISAILFNDPQSAEKTLSALHSAPNILGAGIYKSDGQLFAAYRRDAENRNLPLVLQTRSGQTKVRWFGDRRVEVASPVLFQGKTTGTVYIRSDFRQLTDRLKRYVIIVAVVFLTSLLVAVLMSSLIGRAISGPILQLAETARIVSREKTYSVRAPATRNRDELASLIGTFNEMLEQIQERDTEVREVHDNLERRVAERTAQLDTANKELEAFSYSVVHDLRAPLRHINGFSKILEEDYGPTLDATARHYLRSVCDAAKNMGQLVDDLLKMGQVGRQQMVRRPTNLNLVLEAAVRDLLPECAGRQIDWRLTELPSAECDPGLMKLVFTNLLSNAVKYTRRREKTVIEVGHVKLDSESAVFIRDNGAGFDQKYADKLFGVFQRLHRAEEFEGTGVGLATVQRIVQKHGGRIWAEAELGKGATFFFTLAAETYAPASTTKFAAAGKL